MKRHTLHIASIWLGVGAALAGLGFLSGCAFGAFAAGIYNAFRWLT